MKADVNGASLYYEVVGSGNPLLIMHGGLGFDHTYFRPWIDSLAEGSKLIFYDHRGNGRSDRSKPLDDVYHSTWADDANALREHLGIEKMVLMGHSYGGVLALHYALQYPETLSGLILANTYPAWNYKDTVLEKARERGTPEQVAAVENRFFERVKDDADLEELAGLIGNMYFHDPSNPIAADFGSDVQFSADGYNRGFVDIHAQHNVIDKLSKITIPTLILCGSDDWITPYEQGSAILHAEIPNSKLIMFEKSGHCIFAEEQDQFLNVIQGFMSKF
jgi:proline iminopeptidase